MFRLSNAPVRNCAARFLAAGHTPAIRTASTTRLAQPAAHHPVLPSNARAVDVKSAELVSAVAPRRHLSGVRMLHAAPRFSGLLTQQNLRPTTCNALVKYASVPGKHMVPKQFTQAKFSSAAAGGGKPLFDKILIANRGEIAVRVIKTCKRMGIKTVAVYSDPDRNSKHVLMADEAVHIGPALSAESYLNMDKILDACKKTGAKAVHPGYGFLSENSKFCQLLEQNGIVFIGPKVEALQRMGKKIESKKIARSAGVSTIPGFAGAVKGTEDLLQIANEIGYPVMVKASGGGGGKGMRIAWNDQQAVEGYRLSKEEARKSFGDDTILVEKFIENPRHIEVQIIADGHGNACYLNERECSIQRRNQKVIEEAPSTFIDPATRKKMGEQAVALAKAVGYQCAGTVEMLVDKHRNFYFLEMNTRLQVEHPITEMITGFDLVEHMIRVSAGEKLSFTQADVGINGWAFEARVYAEDPLRGFLPSIGRLTKYQEPISVDPENVRCDSGILEGAEITMHYDPMICKLVTHGKDRNAALDTLRKALDSYVIRGVTHNVNFLRAICDHPRFIKGDISTNFIPEEWPHGFKGVTLTETDAKALVASAALVHAAHLQRQLSVSPSMEGFNPSAAKQSKLQTLLIHANGQEHEVSVDVEYDDYDDHQLLQVKFGGESFSVESIYQPGEWLCEVTVNEHPYVLQVLDATTPYQYKIQHLGSEFVVKVRTPREAELINHMPVLESVDLTKMIVSPMPGAVVSISVKKGDNVIPGQEVCVIEAMKMQNVLRAERDGQIDSILVKVGDTVGADDVLIKFK